MKYFIVILAILVISLNFVSAGTHYYNNSLEYKYSVGEKIRGFLNVSFTDVNADALFESGWGNGVALKYILDASGYVSGVNYTCTPGSCSTGYTNENAVTGVALKEESNATLGFIVQGSGVNNVDVSLALWGSTGGSCSQTLSVDFGNSGNKLVNTNKTAYVCNLKYGCFEQNRNDYTSVTVPWASSYCERINVSIAPALKLGANLTNSTTKAPGLTMKLYDLEGGAALASCDLPNFTATSQSLECLINYPNAAQKEYLACIQAKGDSTYKIRAEVNAPCGTNNFGGTYPIDYEIFVKSLAFGKPVITLNQSTFFASTGKNLAEFVATYIDTNYGSCSPNCVIPFKIEGKTQQVTVSNAKITYDIDGANGVESTQVYNLSKKSAKINSGQLLLNVSAANISVPDKDNKNLVLKIDSSEVLTKKLNISSTFAFDLKPDLVTYGQETLFYIDVPNVSSVKWDFGDGTVLQTTTTNSTKHTFSKEGVFSVSVEASKKNGDVSKRIFQIAVGNVKEAINNTLIKDRANLVSLQGNISAYPVWIKDLVYAQINFTQINASLNALNEQYLNITDANDSRYATIFSNLVALKVPASIDTSKKGSLAILSGTSALDTSFLAGADKYNDASVRAAIVSWMLKNYDATIGYETLEFDYGSQKETFGTKFKIDTKPKTAVSGASLYLGYPVDGIKFAGTYGAKAAGSGAQIDLASNAQTQTFEFVILEDISVEQLSAYISPAISGLGDLSSVTLTCNVNGVCDSGESSDCSDCSNKGWLPYILVFVVLIIGVGAYFGLRWWYAKFYEQKLFKNRQDLLNLMSFITNARRNKVADVDIKKKLKGAGWASEKVDYAFHKLDSRQLGDVRFIKRQ